MTTSGALVVGLVSAAALMLIGRIEGTGRAGGTIVPVRHVSRSPKPQPPKRPPVGTIGRYRVAIRSIVFVDRTVASTGDRELPTRIYYPVVPSAQILAGKYAKGPFPLVVFAPGYRQCGSSYGPLLRSWASAGYVVAGIEFPLTNCHLAKPDESDMINQPADVKSVITRLLALSGSSGKVFSGMIDPAKVAVAGHSDGGNTAAALAANSCCRDHRIIAALILSGAEWAPFGGRYFGSATPPMLYVQGTADTWNPPAASLQLYQSDTTGIRYFVSLAGANHFTPYEGTSAPEPVVARVTIAFLNAYLDGQSGQAGQIAAAGDVPGVSTVTTNGKLPGSSPG